jgi:tetratricopeptide (TPR) repeat protein
MSKFILYRIERMENEPAQEEITPGLKAAACLHRITCHERDPDKYAAIKPQLAALHQQLADYLEATARETAAYLKLKSAQQAKPCVAEPAPARVAMVMAQFGWNWVLLYWDEVSAGGKPWGYRVYRREAFNAPVLVATVLETEALLPDQPEGLHFYYHVTAFNAAGESEPSPTFGLMLNAPDEKETNTGSLHFPAHEMPIRRELGAAMMTFVQKTMRFIFANDEEDTVMRQVATEEYRQAVFKAASQKVEVSLAWHTLAVWTEEGKERIDYFAQALECCRAEAKAMRPKTPKEVWSFIHTQADCLFEIGRVHFHEGAPEAARKFLTEALPLAREADALQAKAGASDDQLEGRIAELLLQLPDHPAEYL